MGSACCGKICCKKRSNSRLLQRSPKIRPTNRTSPTPVRPFAYSPPPLTPPSRPSKQKPKQTQGEDDFKLNSNINDYKNLWPDIHVPPLQTEHSSEDMFKREAKPNKDDKKYLQNTKSDDNWKYSTPGGHSTVDTKSHVNILLTTSGQTEHLLEMLTQTHVETDKKIRDKTDLISADIGKHLDKVKKETKETQERLLTYIKAQHEKREKEYRKEIEDFINTLEARKTNDLYERQARLLFYEDEILNDSQRKIQLINDQANTAKMKTAAQIQEETSAKRKRIVDEINKISNDPKLQSLATNTSTKMEMTITASV